MELVSLATGVSERLASLKPRKPALPPRSASRPSSPIRPSPRVGLSKSAMPWLNRSRDFDAAVADSSFSPKALEGYAHSSRYLLTPNPRPALNRSCHILSSRERSFQRRRLDPNEAITLIFLSRSIDERGARQQCITELRRLLADCLAPH